MPRFSKGQSGNPAGRPAGRPNKLTGDLRGKIADFLAENWEQIKKDFAKLEPKERVQLYDKLLQYCVPRLQTVQSLPSDNEPTIDLGRLTYKERQEL